MDQKDIEHHIFPDMVTNVLHDTTSTFSDKSIVERTNLDANLFYEMLTAAKQPIFSSCR